MRKPTKKDCIGCYNNFYNYNNMGANMTDGKPECWSLKDATFEAAMDIHKDAMPPYKGYPKVKRPNCYRAQGYYRVKPEALTKDGYWKF